MDRGPRLFGSGLALVVAFILALTLLPRAGAQTAERCFPETSFCISGPFRELWERTGLGAIGFPLAAATTGSGAPAESQWFERHRIERHPEQAPPYTLQLGRVGAERLEQLGRDWRADPAASPQDGCRFFAETGRNVCQPFLAAWLASGLELDGRAGLSDAERLALFGLPLTEAREETVDGQIFVVQWFERARFELHGDRVLFGRLGAELLSNGASPAPPPGDGAPAATVTPLPANTPTRRPTSRPRATDRPEDTAVPATEVPPTARPTATQRPTSTPVPNPSLNPPPNSGLPPGFGSTGTLPQQGEPPNIQLSAGAPATTNVELGQAYCIKTDLFNPAIRITISGPQPATTVVETVETNTVSDWRWVPRPGLADGTYTVTAERLEAGVVAETTTGLVNLTNPAAGAGGRVRTIVATADFVQADCFNGTYGERGDTFDVVLSGFAANAQVQLHVLRRLTNAGGLEYVGDLAPVTVDGQGQAVVQIPTGASDTPGYYLVLTTEQANQLATPGYLDDPLVALWEQRINLEPLP